MTRYLQFGSEGWSYSYGAQGHAPGFEAPSYDVSSWPVAAAPFGMTAPSDVAQHQAVSGYPTCAGPYPAVVTSWPSVDFGHKSDLCIRRQLDFRPTDIQVRVDDYAWVWLDGVAVMTEVGGGPTEERTVTFTNAELDAMGISSQPVIAARGRDDAAWCAYLDVGSSLADYLRPIVGRIGFGNAVPGGF